MSERAQKTVEDWDKWDSDRAVFKTHWQEVANYGFPDRSDYIFDRTPGQKRMSFVYDATPLIALDQFACGLHSRLTSNTLQWFYLQTEDDRLNADGEVQGWLEPAAASMYRRFNSPRHNFASQSYELYMDQGSIGNAVMAVLESPRSGILFSTRHMKECVYQLNEEDRVDTLIRSWKWTAKQAVDQWTLETLKRAGCEKVLKAYADGDMTPRFRFLHDVRPRKKRDPQRRDRRHKAWESLYISADDLCEIDVGGFDEFPYLAPRFSKLTGETYGRGRMQIALPDIKMLNELMKITVKSAQKVIDPPLQAPDDGFLVPVRTVPGAINYYRASSKDRIVPIETKGQVQLAFETIEALRQQILKTMYVDLMMMPVKDPRDPSSSGKDVTATWVAQYRDDRMGFLSPILARAQSEFLGPLIDRVFAILWRQSVALRFGPGSPFPPPPAKLSGARLRVEYVSPIALAQKASQMDGVMRLLQMQQQIRVMDPQSIMVIDPEYIMRLAQRDWNAPVGTLKSPQQLAQEQQQKAQAEAAMAQHMQMEQAAGAVKDVAHAAKHVADAGAAANAGGQEQEAA